nr:MAG TPA: Major capsid protein [Bacteriophage sp.]DAP93150.1 MAG TPA: Major capsid protein [Caudoviricetes sp.]
MAIATSFGVLNYSGMLFNKGNTRCPLSSIIGGRAKTTNHVEFVTGQEYTTAGGTQPAISETASLTAPEATVVTRAQKTNVTQIFHESVGISYAKQSNMGTLSGINIASQQANPMNELDFQVAAKMQKVNRDIEFTFVQGEYNKATTDATVNKTRGLTEAIESNVIAMASKPLGLWNIADGVKKVYEANAPQDGLVLWCDATTMFQINADAVQNGLTVIPAAREINGIKLSSVVTPLGVVYLYLGEFLPKGTALLLNLDVIAPVYQPVPGKGNFFLEPLSKTGAGEQYQLFGQIGLDHGPEWYHAKFTGIAQTFTAPTYSRSVFIANDAKNPVNTKAVTG